MIVQLSTPIAKDYLALLQKFSLREIRSDKELERAHAVLRPLFLRGEHDLSAGESDYLGALSVLVHDYEQRRYPIPPDKRTPLQRLKYVLEESQTTPADLIKVLGVSQSLVSLILSGKRELTKSHVLKLAEHFKLDAIYFL